MRLRLDQSKGIIFYLQNTKFEDQMLFTIKSSKSIEHQGYWMTAALQHMAAESRERRWSADPRKEKSKGEGSCLKDQGRSWIWRAKRKPS